MPSSGPFIQRKDELQCTIPASIKQHKPTTTKNKNTRWEIGRPDKEISGDVREKSPPPQSLNEASL